MTKADIRPALNQISRMKLPSAEIALRFYIHLTYRRKNLLHKVAIGAVLVVTIFLNNEQSDRVRLA
jgi:hypothetical protein